MTRSIIHTVEIDADNIVDAMVDDHQLAHTILREASERLPADEVGDWFAGASAERLVAFSQAILAAATQGA